MKKDLHPISRITAFRDSLTNTIFLLKSTTKTKDTIILDGIEYPLVKVEVSSDSHPFYTGTMKQSNSAGRSEKFKEKYKKFKKTTDSTE